MNQGIQEAVEYMKQSTSVQDWNKRREDVFKSFGKATPELIQAIDGANQEGKSLIVETLGKNI